MRQILSTTLLALFVIGCAKPDQDPRPIHVPPIQVEPEPEPVEPITPRRHFSASYIRGYQDGYSGNWLAPGNWLVRNDYRSGWSAGERDRKAGNPNKFD